MISRTCTGCPVLPFGGCGGQTTDAVILPPCPARVRLLLVLLRRALTLPHADCWCSECRAVRALLGVYS